MTDAMKISSIPKQLGQLAFNRLQILDALKAERNVESLKEQLREIDKQMVLLGWDGKAHTVIMTSNGPRIKKPQLKPKGKIIRVKPFKMSAHINKYV